MLILACSDGGGEQRVNGQRQDGWDDGRKAVARFGDVKLREDRWADEEDY